MSDGVSFDVGLKDDVSGPAKAASLGATTLTKAMASLQTQAIKAQALGDTTKLEKLAGQYDKFGAALAKLPKPAADGSAALKSIEEPAGGAGEALGGLEEELGPLTGGLSVLAGVVLSVGAAVGALVFEGAKFALESSDFKNSTLVSLKALLGTEAAAEDTYGQIDGIAKRIGVSQADVAGKATELINSGVKSGAQLEATLKASYALAAVDPAGASKLEAIIKKSAGAGSFQLSKKQLAGTGVSYKDIAKQLGVSEAQLTSQIKAGQISAEKGLDALNAAINGKLGDLAHEKALATLPGQLGILKATATSIFSNVNTKPFVEGLGKIVALVDEGTPSGQAMKAALVGGFDAVFKVASSTLPVIKAFLLELVIAGLKVYIAIKPAVDHFKKLFEGGDNKNAIQAVELLADGIGYVAEKTADLIVFTAYMVEGTIAGYQAVAGAVSSVVDEVTAAYNAVASLFSGSEGLGTSFVDGIVSGIENGASRVYDAAKNLANSAEDSVKSALGIASPSKVMADLGGHTADGFAAGVDAGAPAASDAMVALATPPELAGPSSGSGGGGGVTIEVGGITIQIDGAGKSAQEIAEIVMSDIVVRLEELATQVNG